MAGWGYVEKETAGNKVRVLKGAEWDDFTAASHDNWLHSQYTITNSSDRMGYRLSGNALQLKKKKDMISTAVCHGNSTGNP